MFSPYIAQFFCPKTLEGFTRSHPTTRREEGFPDTPPQMERIGAPQLKLQIESLLWQYPHLQWAGWAAALSNTKQKCRSMSLKRTLERS